MDRAVDWTKPERYCHLCDKEIKITSKYMGLGGMNRKNCHKKCTLVSDEGVLVLDKKWLCNDCYKLIFDVVLIRMKENGNG